MSDQLGMETSSNSSANRVQDSERDNGLLGKLSGSVPKRGPGRPKGSGAKKQGDSTPSANRVENSRANAEQDCSFFVATAISLCEMGDSFLKEILLSRLRQYIKDEEKVREFDNKLLAVNSLGPREIELLKIQLTALALKYDILRKIGPEVCLLVFTGQYSLRMFRMFKFVESMKPNAPKAKPIVPVAEPVAN
jgi:hypothetical protein